PRARARLHLDRSVRWPRIRRQQPESVTAEATAHDPRAQGAGALQLVDGRLDRWGRDLVVVAKARMSFVQQPPEPPEIVLTERLHRLVDARVRAHHVTPTPVERSGQLAHHLERCVAQAPQTEQLSSPAALGASLVVAGGDVRVLLAGVQRDQLVPCELQRDRLDLEAAEVDPQRTTGLAV